LAGFVSPDSLAGKGLAFQVFECPGGSGSAEFGEIDFLAFVLGVSESFGGFFLGPVA